MTTGAKRIVGLATLALALASSAVALAGTPGGYKLHLSVPETVLEGSDASITAHGYAPDRVQLEVLVSTGSGCSFIALAEEKKLPKPKELIKKEVDKNFSDTVRYLAPKGEHRACAYLFKVGMPFDTVAHAGGSWRVSKKK
jgi:hypothetical protein